MVSIWFNWYYFDTYIAFFTLKVGFTDSLSDSNYYFLLYPSIILSVKKLTAEHPKIVEYSATFGAIIVVELFGSFAANSAKEVTKAIKYDVKPIVTPIKPIVTTESMPMFIHAITIVSAVIDLFAITTL